MYNLPTPLLSASEHVHLLSKLIKFLSLTPHLLLEGIILDTYLFSVSFMLQTLSNISFDWVLTITKRDILVGCYASLDKYRNKLTFDQTIASTKYISCTLLRPSYHWNLSLLSKYNWDLQNTGNLLGHSCI